MGSVARSPPGPSFASISLDQCEAARPACQLESGVIEIRLTGGLQIGSARSLGAHQVVSRPMERKARLGRAMTVAEVADQLGWSEAAKAAHLASLDSRPVDSLDEAHARIVALTE